MTANNSILIGAAAGINIAGTDNICIGNTAGRTTDGDRNIFIGKQAGKLCEGDENIEFVTNGPSTSILNGYSKKIHIANTIVGDAVTQRLAIGSVGSGDLSPDATLEIKPSGTTTVGMIVQAEASHTASLTEWQDSSETVLASVAADGAISASGAITAATGIALQRNTPATTTDKLYNVAGALYFDGSEVGGGGGSPGGSDTQVQFNDSSSFGGDADLTWNKTSNTLTIAGHLAATTKSFLIDHPTKEGKKLQYASLEGPEHGVYVRGYTDVNTITLPDYWTELVHNDSLTVHLTPKDFAQPNLFVSGIIDNKIYLQSDGQISSYYIVNGTRKDVDPLEVEI